MGGLKKGTGSLNFEDEKRTDDNEEGQEQGQEQRTDIEAESQTQATDASTDSPVQPDEHETVPTQRHSMDSASQAEPPTATSSPIDSTPQGPNFDMDNLPYLVQRQMRGAPVNADRTNQLLLEVRPFVKDDEDTYLDDLKGLVDGPVYKGDAREAAMIVAQENPELVAEKLREWGIEYLDT